MKILDGKKLSDKILADLKKQVSELPGRPVLAIVFAGDDASSKIYIENKKRASELVGIEVREHGFPENVSEESLIERIAELNDSPEISAIIVQLPLPATVDRYNVFAAIKPEKDADCLSPLNFGSFFQKGESNFPIGPATPVGIIRLLEEYNIPLEKKYAVLVGYSDIVGKPLSEMLLFRGATVTICHDKTHNLSDFTQLADILVSATGVKHLINGEMVKSGVVAVDVGISREGKKITGDIDFESVSPKTAFITPVPGGIGPMTVAILLENVVRLARLQADKYSGTRVEPKEKTDESLEIESEFNQLIATMNSQQKISLDLKTRIAKARAKARMIATNKKESDKILLETIDIILAEKLSGWLFKKENYIQKIQKHVQKARRKIEKSLAGLKLYENEVSRDEIEGVSELQDFRIPEEYGDDYDVCKNYLTEEIEKNDRGISELETEDRDLEEAASRAEKELGARIGLTEEWHNWADEHSQDEFENERDLEAAVERFFEKEKAKISALR